jgi:hypothetical protein
VYLHYKDYMVDAVQGNKHVYSANCMKSLNILWTKGRVIVC